MRIFVFFFLGQFESKPQDHLREEFCQDRELYDECVTSCRLNYLGCLASCDSASCNSFCLSTFSNCEAYCPCGQNCLVGCKGCENEICSRCDNAEEDNEEYKTCRDNAILDHNECMKGCPPFISCYEDCQNIEIAQMRECPCVSSTSSSTTSSTSAITTSTTPPYVTYTTWFNGSTEGCVNFCENIKAGDCTGGINYGRTCPGWPQDCFTCGEDCYFNESIGPRNCMEFLADNPDSYNRTVCDNLSCWD
ncbi:Oidioi.mRNA.OKI2018_I69.chr2.g5005.t1.cds [Oikopleura dioica]|uniref:Oidioi.mRNA.OKI2018_I69.chr2.g5005.t1.cds n=1 Tax=Oikopleura dioica TaxID=34765 RepID=A0ABN7T4R0_OIKDI|nr:Oidioi.mRNA.OKI2018_I69.chr2.g5005.t1.cds [Oikopleura dioica]